MVKLFKNKNDSGSELNTEKVFLVRLRFEKSFIFGGHDNCVFISLNSECKISPLFQNISICLPVAQSLPVGETTFVTFLTGRELKSFRINNLHRLAAPWLCSAQFNLTKLRKTTVNTDRYRSTYKVTLSIVQRSEINSFAY